MINPIWEEENTIASRKALEQIGIATGKREIENLSKKGIAIVFKRGNKIIERKNGIEKVVYELNIKHNTVDTDVNGVAKHINKEQL